MMNSKSNTTDRTFYEMTENVDQRSLRSRADPLGLADDDVSDAGIQTQSFMNASMLNSSLVSGFHQQSSFSIDRPNQDQSSPASHSEKYERAPFSTSLSAELNELKIQVESVQWEGSSPRDSTVSSSAPSNFSQNPRAISRQEVASSQNLDSAVSSLAPSNSLKPPRTTSRQDVGYSPNLDSRMSFVAPSNSNRSPRATLQQDVASSQNLSSMTPFEERNSIFSNTGSRPHGYYTLPLKLKDSVPSTPVQEIKSMDFGFATTNAMQSARSQLTGQSNMRNSPFRYNHYTKTILKIIK